MIKEYRKALDVGKTIHEKSAVNLLIVLAAIVGDSIVTFYSFDSVSSDTQILKIVLAAEAIFLLDYTPTLIAVELFKEHKPSLKIAIIVFLTVLILISAGLLAKFRFDTVGSMFRPSVGLLEVDTPPEISTLGVIMAFCPFGTTILIFCHAVICHNPRKAKEKLKLIEIASRERTTELETALCLYDNPAEVNTDEPSSDLNKMVAAKQNVNKEDITLVSTLNKLLFKKMLAESMNANSEQVETLMESHPHTATN